MEILSDYLSEKGNKFSISSFFKDKNDEIERFNDTLDIENKWQALDDEWSNIVENFLDTQPEEPIIKRDFHNVDFNRYMNKRKLSHARQYLENSIIEKVVQDIINFADELGQSPTSLPPKKRHKKK